MVGLMLWLCAIVDSMYWPPLVFPAINLWSAPRRGFVRGSADGVYCANRQCAFFGCCARAVGIDPGLSQVKVKLFKPDSVTGVCADFIEKRD